MNIQYITSELERFSAQMNEGKKVEKERKEFKSNI